MALLASNSQYVYMLPLEDCIDVLQNQSGQRLNPKWRLSFGRRVTITITPNTPDNSTYILRTPLGRGYVSLKGHFQRIDRQSTEITIYEKNFVELAIVVIGLLITLMLVITKIIGHNIFSPLIDYLGLILFTLVFSWVATFNTKRQLKQFLLSIFPPSNS